MADENSEAAERDKQVQLYLTERTQLIDAARESARTFDKAVLAFGSAVFGFSIAFLKDVAPSPAPATLKWLGFSWTFFSLGLLAILLSFLFSHRACMFEIDVGEKVLTCPTYQRPKKNPWSIATTRCNFLSVGLLFLGLLCWSMFALRNIGNGSAPMSKSQDSAEKKGYLPLPQPVKSNTQLPAPQPTPQR
jgi:hypothetical protein